MKIHSSQRGFSLVEVLIYVGILSVVLVIVAQASVTISRAHNRSVARTEVRNAIRFVTEKIKSDTATATSIVSPDVSASGSVLKLGTPQGVVVYCLVNYRIRRAQGTTTCDATTQAISSPNIQFSAFTLTRAENSNMLTSEVSNSVQISTTALYNATNPDLQYKESINETALLSPNVFASPQDAVLVYARGVSAPSIQERLFRSANGNYQTKDAFSAVPWTGSVKPKFVSLESSPKRTELMLGIQDASGQLQIYRSANSGLSWQLQWSVAVGDGNLQRFDIKYEQASGDALVAYSTNSGSAPQIAYRTYDGRQWSSALTYTTVRTSGLVYGVRAAANPKSGSDAIGIAWIDTNFDISANVWSGTTFVGEPSAALTTDAARAGASSVPTHQDFDLAFQPFFNKLYIVYGVDGVGHTQEVNYNMGTSSWAAAQDVPGNEEGTLVVIGADAATSLAGLPKVGVASCSPDTGTDCDFMMKYANGASETWSGVANETNVMSLPNGSVGVSVSFVKDQLGDPIGVFLFDGSPVAGIDWYKSTFTQNDPQLQMDITAAPTVGGEEVRIIARSNEAIGLYAFLNNFGQIYFKLAKKSGTNGQLAWTSLEPSSGPVESAVSLGGFSPVGLTFQQYAP